MTDVKEEITDEFPESKQEETTSQLQLVAEETKTTSQLVALKCKKCRRTLISNEDFVTHTQGSGQTAFSYNKRDNSYSSMMKEKYNSKPLCSSYFIEPLDWIFSEDKQSDKEESELDGKIKCPKCKAKLGNYNWAGMQCSCGTWVTPSFAIHREKVDEVY
ncbi:dual specificity protein phosphatase 12 [Gigaspora margarita]|uniref:protein-tyrosine-phosphatase n=1 Tax=Gigaspora margarita TaxID=4874 RepID=A0A8H4EPW7_GIGMA|nr:dual specificity protein phosphatase 12 [Gigaspora margarita]